MTTLALLAALPARLVALGRWLWRHRTAAALTVLTAGVWLYRARARRLAGARDAEHQRADKAEADAATVTEVLEAREAGHALAEEIRDVPTTADPAADRAALYDRVREIARREGATPSVPDDAPAGPGARDPARDRR